MNVFKEYANVYDIFNQDKDYKKESIEIEHLIKEYTHSNKILMLGCGTGRHDRELAKAGYNIHGIDISQEMITIAERNGNCNKLTYETGDIREYCSNNKYPIILSLFHVMSYQTDTNDLLKVFQNVSTMLEDDGVFIFDAWYGPGVLTDLPSIRIKRVETEVINVHRIAEPTIYLERNTVDVHYDIYITEKETGLLKNIEELHSMRYMFIPELRNYLEQCGLTLIQCLDCKTLKKTDKNSWTAYFIVKKK